MDYWTHPTEAVHLLLNVYIYCKAEVFFFANQFIVTPDRVLTIDYCNDWHLMYNPYLYYTTASYHEESEKHLKHEEKKKTDTGFILPVLETNFLIT